MSEIGQFLEDKPIELMRVVGWTDGNKRQGSVTMNWGGIVFCVSGQIEMFNANDKLPGDAFYYVAPVEDSE